MPSFKLTIKNDKILETFVNLRNLNFSLQDKINNPIIIMNRKELQRKYTTTLLLLGPEKLSNHVEKSYRLPNLKE